MSGPKTYAPTLTPEQQRRIELIAESERLNTQFSELLRRYKEKSSSKSLDEGIRLKLEEDTKKQRDSIENYVQCFKAEFSGYEYERMLSDEEILAKKRVEYDNVIEQYARVCAVLDIEMADCFEFDELRYDEIISQVKVETKRLEQVQIKQLQDKLIYDTTLKVLAEMGYELVGANSIVKKTGVTVKSTLLRLDKDTAVNITSTSNGQYTFELVSVNDDGHYLTEKEIKKLLDLMLLKCPDDFKIMKEKYAKEGIVLDDVIERAPDISYCRAKNLNDYIPLSEDAKECSTCLRETECMNGTV